MKRSLIAILTLMVLAGFGPAPARSAGEPESPPPPPEKVFEDGTPWTPVDQEAAMARALPVPDLIRETAPNRSLLTGQGGAPDRIGLEQVTHRYMVLESPVLNQSEDPFADLYGPVRFMHLKHAAVVGDCTQCHHHRPAGGPDEADAAQRLPVRCVACHQTPFDAALPDRPGLKAAYHQQCMGCHRTSEKGPLDCTGCHEKQVPDHADLVELPANPDPFTVTRECLRCHDDAAEDMLTSAHWLWRGPSPHTVGAEERVDMGKATNTINNFCVGLPSNWPRCTSCHAGYGWTDGGFDFTDKTRIDCLVCHDTTLTYRKVPTEAGMPYPQLDLKKIAQSVGKPSRKTCGDCHFQGGGGDSVKHGDMNGVLYYPSRSCDVHMGGMDFQCHECHKTRNHKISGRSLSVPVAEGSRSCEDCHSEKPHKRTTSSDPRRNLLMPHLNRHTDHLYCQTCHSPVYAKCRPTKTWWDWSKAGDKSRKPRKDKYGMPDYFWKKGEFRWAESVRPAYLWYNGRVKRHLIGDRVPGEGVLHITEPVGAIQDRKSRIFPFKPMRGIQMMDRNTRQLIVPHLYGPGGFWKDLDWQAAFRDGMAAAGLTYSGEHDWVETVMYWGLNHETMPAANALGCTQCHEALRGETSCDRCHQDSRHVDFRALAEIGTDFAFMAEKGRDVSRLITQTDYIDFKALGYPGDPIIHGGRFKKLPLGTRTAADRRGMESERRAVAESPGSRRGGG